MIKIQWLLLFVFLCSCSIISVRDNMCYKWEYVKCVDGKSNKIKYSEDSRDIYVPIFDIPITRRVIDSLCYQLLSDYNDKAYSKKKISVSTFGEYYYSDATISIAVSEANRIHEDEFSFKCYINESKFELSEHSGFQIIYIPNIGIVYAISLSDDNPIVANLLRHCDFNKKEWEIKKREYLSPYIVVDCSN